ncbi:glutamate synthase (NADH) large subunit [Hypnocyclicus thermotrophus]|uniref:Glutamate synthase (NADH) large subunit n=1 Tax=Hypnocyclicus thermotrophus TaxID=1627895 RepID=A0AA46DY25_9FUSO|nr:glutamate synthase large subunit [Hypnocyclicus thermotrophus]TDT69193.1 glutamate synthase (NADH) large subunit [Hypnocyclicus thermotrophus]
MKRGIGIPEAQGLYSPLYEKDNCGIGLVANIKGIKSHDIVKNGIRVLEKIEHRGAVGADPTTGDGAGILLQLPHKFFTKVIDNLPEFSEYGVGMIFFPKNKNSRTMCKETIENIVKNEGFEIIAWREVPVNTKEVGKTAELTRPYIKQLFIKNNGSKNFELKLYILRKQIENAVKELEIEEKEYFYIPSMSSKTIVYKGLLLADQVHSFYLDLQDKDLESAIALVHQRYSTNTFPSWDLAQPFRYLAHNGEINTIKGNVNWMLSREPELFNDVIGEDIKKLFPINDPIKSDSANLDNALELLIASGKSLLDAASILVPMAWENNPDISEDLKAYFEYYSGLVEPWDGPAALAMTDGRYILGKLDRNGLRPARYIITHDDTIILASEAGTLEIEPKNIKSSNRLQPGKVLLIDTENGKIFDENEIENLLTKSKPFKKWLERKKSIDELPMPKLKNDYNKNEIIKKFRAFGYTREELKEVIANMAKNSKEPIGSMGNDAALAVLSNKSKNIFAYFKQLFAQVTNPPIDPIREEIVMSLTTNIGIHGNILIDKEENCDLIKLDTPILSNIQLAKIENLDSAEIIDICFDKNLSLEEGLNNLFENTKKIIKSGKKILILSDKNISKDKIAIPVLLATAGLHHYLIQNHLRNGIDLIIETGEAREVMHFALLIGYGALAINPYLALDSIKYLCETKQYLTNSNIDKKQEKYIKAIGKGLLKIMSKMGISTIQSYRGAQIFEALGLKNEFINKYFKGTPSRIEGVGIDVIEKETRIRHDYAFDNFLDKDDLLVNEGEYKWRKKGEKHLFSPEAVATLQYSTRIGNYEEYKKYSKIINEQSEALATIRGLFKLKKSTPISIEEVEPVENIMKRFVTGAMSFGSISREAHEALAIAMNTIGGKSNSGEGGEDPARFLDNRRSAIKQIASGRFGVTTHYLVNADELQIKMAQGAKPGEGGHLPGHKVSEEIASVRHTSPGIDLISPPPHHDIYSIEDLAQLIFDLKNVNPQARVSVKLVSEVGVGTVAAGVSKAHADMILISGYDGGTGAAPLSSIKHAGLPWELGLSEAHQVLILNNLRDRVRIQADGQLKTGRDVVIAALLGAEEFGFATAPLVVLGCVMMRSCHTNTCQVGVATQDPVLRKRFLGRSEYVINFFRFIAQEVREIMAELGFRTLDEMIGRTDLIEMNDAINHWKANGVDISKILYKPQVDSSIGTKCLRKQNHGIDSILDRELINLAKPALENGEKIIINKPIINMNRTTGTMLSGEVAKKYGSQGLPDDTITLNFKGVAGQSFAVFGMKGITYNLEGQGNDYIGKGLFGAKVIIKAPKEATFKPEDNIIGGNTILYGAIKGEAYFNGRVGERFCVRNSGAYAVVEGIGDHGCEYMTGGRAVILGTTGRNFGAGMSGGIAYVYDIDGKFESRLNKNMVIMEKVDDETSINELKSMIEKHYQYTNSNRAKEILENWDQSLQKFVKVLSPEYKALLLEGKVK